MRNRGVALIPHVDRLQRLVSIVVGRNLSHGVLAFGDSASVVAATVRVWMREWLDDGSGSIVARFVLVGDGDHCPAAVW